MKHILRALALTLALLPGIAAAQAPQFPQNLPANTVIGRLGIGPGPSQAIPIQQLGQAGILGNAFTQFAGPTAPTKTFTLPNVTGTLAMLSQAQTWTAAQTFLASNFITNANLAQMPAFTIKGNSSGASANAADLTGAQVEQLLQFTQTGTGAVQRPLDAKVKELVSVKDFGVVGDGVADDTAKLNAWLLYLSTNSKTGYWPAGTYKITSALTPVVGSNWGIVGDGGYQTVLSYQGTSTTADIMTVGDGTTTSTGVNVSGFSFVSTTNMTGGTALRFRKQLVYRVDDVKFSNNFTGNNNLFNGFWSDSSQWGSLFNSHIHVKNDGVIATNGVELNIDNTQILGTGSNCIHVGGGFGGLYTGYVSMFGYGIGILVDTSIVATANNQIFVSNLTVADNMTVSGYRVDDALPANKSFTMQGWGASTLNGGQGFTIANWKNGTVNFTGAQFVSNSGSGIFVADPTAHVQIDGSTNINGNTGVGVNGLSATNNVFSDAQPFGNGGGSYAAVVNVEQLGATGFRKFANGYIRQWGSVAGNAAADTAVTFPIAFPNSVFSVVANTVGGSNSAGVLESVSLSAPTTTGFTGFQRAIVGATSPVRGADAWNWEAWGR